MLFVSWFSSCCLFFFFKQKTAYEMRISDWSSDVCSSDLLKGTGAGIGGDGDRRMRLRRRHRRVGGSGQHLEGREISDGGERAAGKDDRLAPDPVAEPAEEDEKGRRSEERRVGKECGSTCRSRWSS